MQETNAINMENTESKYHLKNTMESIVIEKVTEKFKNTSDACTCEKCFYDICAIVLNSLSPHYTTTAEGELMDKTKVTLNIQIHSRVSIEVLKAIELVKSKPMHK